MHRDLKPENILFREGTLSETDVCLIDFGLASFFDPKKIIYVRCGTPGKTKKQYENNIFL